MPFISFLEQYATSLVLIASIVTLLGTLLGEYYRRNR